MNQRRNFLLSLGSFFFFVTFFISRRAQAGTPIDTASNAIVRNAVNQSGSTSTYTSYDLNGDLGELSGSTISYTSYQLFPGLLQINSFPGPVSNFSAVSLSSVSAQINWNAPGIDGSLGTLPSGSSYHVEYASAIPSWNYSNTQITISTSGVNPGDPQDYPISGLLPNTTYFFGIWTEDSFGNLSYLSTGAVAATLSQPINSLSSNFLMVGASSATAAWTALAKTPSSSTSEGYELDASTASDFSGTILSSVTASVLDSTLTVSGLNPDTTYYFRVGSLNWNQLQDFVSIGSTVTSAASPALLNPAFTMVGITSTTVQWSSNANPAGVNYLLNLSTDSNFTGALFSSATLNLSATLTGLNPNTTYYAEVEATGLNNISSAFTALGSTMTKASPPQTVSPSFNPVYITSLTVTFQNGSPANPAGTFYDVQISTDPAFSVWTDSFTQNLNASFTNLLPDTSYYVQAAGENNLGVLSVYQNLGSTATLSVLPGTLAQSYSNLSGSGFTLSWASGTLSSGFNPGNASYEAQAAQDSGFTSGVVDVIVSTTSAGFTGLTPNTVYYTRARALNWQNIPTPYVDYGSTSTLISAVPSFLSGTFLVSNALGVFQSPTLYTDTTTPSLQVQVLSAFNPGLSITNTPNTWAIWHFDEGSGTVGYDASFHGNNLDLTGTVAWQSGIVGDSVYFDGTTTYGYSVNQVNNPATFTIAAWFKTAANYSSGGKIIGFGNVQTGASSNYDRHIYMINSGQLIFGVYNNAIYTITSPSSYNDGNWHYAMGTISSAGMYFYVDGQEVGTNPNTASQAYAGYWRVGYDNLNGWLNPPSSYYFQGNIDEVFIDTNDALSPSQALAYYQTVKNSHELGEPSVNISTTAGDADTWVRMSTAAFDITGTTGTTSTQLWSSTVSISGLSLVQSTAPLATTNQIFFLASDVKSEIGSSQYTVLVDTTPPLVPNFTSLIDPTTFSLTVHGLSGYDALSGLAAQPFDIQASTDPNFGGILADSGFISGSSYTFNSLNANTTYYVRARAEDAATNISAFSAAQSLATLTHNVSSSQIMSASSNTAILSWAGLPISPSSTTSEGYELDASTASDFSGTVFSSSTNSNTQTTLLISGLNSDTTYYFRIGSLNWEGLPNYISAGSTSTLAGAPSALTLLSISTNAATLSWTAGSGPNQGYELNASSTDFNGTGTALSSATSSSALTSLSVSGLLANTTYFFRVGSLNWNDSENDSALISSATWSEAASINSPTFLNVSVSSVQVQWAALPLTPESSSAEGYELLASTAPDFTGFIFSTATPNVLDSTLTITGLASLTTYYFEVGTYNWNKILDFAFLGSTETQSSSQNQPPAAVTDLTASTDTETSLNLEWSAPSDPYSNPWNGNYAIQYSTWSGVVWSTSNAQVLFTTSSVLAGTSQYYELMGLNANTTYYIHLWASDTVPNWSSLSNGATQAVLAESISGLAITASSSTLTASWTPLPLTPSSSTSEGYLFNVSTMPNFTGLIFSSQTNNASVGNLSVFGLNANTTYYFEAGSLNWNDAPNYNYLIDSTSTLSQPINSVSSSFLMMGASSSTLGWSALPLNPSSFTSEGYELDASTASDFSGAVLSSMTLSVLDSTLTVSGLSPDATYYFRVGSLDWDQEPDFVFVGSTLTSAAIPAILSPAFTMVGITSTTVEWGTNGNPTGADYLLNLSTAANFTGTLFSSNTLNLSTTITGLNPNTTYYAEVEATGINGISSGFALLGSTPTQASRPISPANPFSPVYSSSLTVSFQNGTPANPTGTIYEMLLSTDPAFSVYFASSTANFSAGFTGLLINTSYYAEAAGENWQNVLSSFTPLGSTSTLAVIPGGPGIFSGVSGNSLSVSWSSGTAGGGYNPSWTEYDLQVSTNSNFTGAVVNNFTTALSGSVSGLLPGTVYYAQAAGVNQDGVLSPFVSLGSTTTANSAIPSFINGSFLVSNALGSFQSPTLYTDTTTPNLQVQILSNSAPGLSVTDTPDTWAIWHLDEDAGTVGYDASLHGDNLDLTGTITWQPGILGSSVYFDGSTTEGYGVNQVANPTTFTIAAWFKTANGYNAGGKIIGFGNAQTGASSNYDRHIYMTNGGTLEFGVYTGATQMAASGSPYNDGNWHFVMATLSGAGMYLYVDGKQVGYNSNTAAQTYNGYWRLGYDNLTGWPNAPTSYYFQGNIDEVFINNTDALSASQAAIYYNLVKNETHELGAPNVDVSTQAGNNLTWLRFSTAAFAITGADGTTAQQFWSSTFTLDNFSLVQTTAPGAATNQVMFLGDSADSQMTTAQFTVLVDTTPPVLPTFSLESTTYSVTANNLSSFDSPSGLAFFDVQISTYSNFSSINQDSGFFAATRSSWIFNSLNANTTYYAQARAEDNATNVSAFSPINALSTLAQPPSGLAATAASENSATLIWTALLASPQALTSEGYEVEASSMSDFSGTIYSSATASVSDNLLTVSGLLPDTTYYFRVGSLDWSGIPNFSPGTISTATLAQIPASLTLNSISTNTAALSWTQGVGSNQGYLLEASSTNFNGTGIILSSATTSSSDANLSLSSLIPNTTYEFRVSAVNWNNLNDFTANLSSSSWALPISPSISQVLSNSISASWTPLPPAPSSATSEGYELDASSTNFGAISPGGAIYFSSATSSSVGTLTVSGLDFSTVYYLRAGSFNWDGIADYTAMPSTSALAAEPLFISPAFTMVEVSSTSVQWGANGNPNTTQYNLNLSTASNFTGTLFSSSTLNTFATLTGLNPNTTYYAEVQSVSGDGALTPFVSLGSTMTLASEPQVSAVTFNPVYVTSLTVSFLNGSPANPSNTFYDVELSTDPAFSVYSDSLTENLGASFTGLLINTTYYAQVSAENGLNEFSPYQNLNSTSTLAVPTGTNTPTFSGISAQSFTLSWSSGTLANGYNPDGTVYLAQISTAADFSNPIEAIVSSTQTSFSGLVSGTLYYAEVAALNNQNILSAFTNYASVTTLNSAAPTYLANSFQLTDSLGVYIPPTQYTDTTTPNMQVQVQSNYTPGLSVTDTPSQLALWHLDEGAGASSFDSSLHGNTLTLNGGYSWVPGLLGSAVQFDGSTGYGVSPDVSGTGWRTSSANNQWSVALWFNTGLAHGYLFQVANSNAAGAGTYDGELSWYKSTGKLTFEITRSNGTRYYASASASYNNNLWHFATGVLNTSGFYLYVDGNLAASNTSVNSTNARTYAGPTYLWLGAASTLGANMGGSTGVKFYPGTIDEVLVTTVALTAPQISQLYALTSQETHEIGAPNIDLSTQAGANYSWTRLSTATFNITGTDGTTAAQTWTSTLTLSNFSFVQSTAPAAPTNQAFFLEDSLDSQLTTAQYTILVDTTPPSVPTFSALMNPTTFGLTIPNLSATDSLSGLNATPFDVQASTDINFGIINADSGWITGPNFTFSTLLANTTYFVRAEARNAAGSQGIKSGWSSSQDLATLSLQPSATSFLNVYFSSVTAAWTALKVSPSSSSSEGYEVDASTAPDFSGLITFSSTTNVLDSTLTVTGLDLNTTYYFRVASLNWGNVENDVVIGDSVTLAQTPLSNPPNFISIATSAITAEWAGLPLNPQSQTAEEFLLETSSTNFGAILPGGITDSSATSDVLDSTLTISGLLPNTTYFFKVASFNWDNTPTFLILGDASSLANTVVNPSTAAVYVSSVAISWNLPAGGAEGYEVDASTAANFTGTIVSSITLNGLSTELELVSLQSVTTYYFRVGAFNWNEVPNFVASGSTVTHVSVDTSSPTAVTTLAASTLTATTSELNWITPTPVDPNSSDQPLSGSYAIEYSTWTGVVWSTSNAQIVFSTSGVNSGDPESYTASGLNPNTTYYFELWTANSRPNWSSLSNGATVDMLADTVSTIAYVSITTGSIGFEWAPLSNSPQPATSEGYKLDASTSSSFTGTVFSSVTADVNISSLVISGLNSNTTYFFRLGSLNWNQVPNYVLLPATSSLSGEVSTLNPSFLDVFETSSTVNWAALPQNPSSSTSEGYALDASTASDFSGTILSSVTASVLDSTLTVSGLNPDTTYFFRVGSLNWNSAPNYATLPDTSTLANTPNLVLPSYTAATNTALSAEWGSNANPSSAIYELDLSTASNFTGTLLSSVTLNISATVSGLNPNTTYYGRVFAENNDEVNSAFLSLASTMTLASPPNPAAVIFNPVFVSSLTINYTSGTPANPANTLYDIQLSTDPAFSVFLDSQTQNLSAGFTGLSPNTTYYAQGAAFNSLGTESVFNSLTDSATLAVSPVGPGAFSGVGSSEFSVSWGSGTLATGYNPDGTNYLVEASTDPAFGIINSQVLVSTNSAGVSGLLSGTLYYVQVQAINWSGINTPFVSLGSATTLNSAAPTYLANSFQIGDSLGVYIPPTQYTDTTTPNMQVQVQSNYTPGLSVTDTPSQLALWHLDEDAGASSFDSSLHGNTLTLNGGYSWVPGILGSAVQFDGSTGYGVSPDVSGTGWRTNAANNQWSIGLWFNTGLAHGYLFQVANSNAAGAGTYDGELSWYRTTGKMTFEITNNAGTRYYASASASYNNNLWHFATGVLNTSGFYLYVDGNLVASNTSVNSTTARTYAGPTYLWLGAASTLSANMGGSTAVKFYPGTIDEVLVTTVALTAPQISQLYALTSQETHEMGAPNVDLSTQAGANYSWTRLSTTTFHITGTDGTTAAQTWTSTLTLSNFSFIQSTAPAAPTNQAFFLEDSLDSQLTTTQYTILVDTTPPSVPTFSALTNPTTFGLTVSNLSATDNLSGLNSTPFNVEASTDPNFGIINQDSGWITGANFTFSTLLANTTYFVRAQARSAAGSEGVKSSWSSSQDLATLSLQPSATSFLNVYFSSVTAAWTALKVSPSSNSSEGYEVDASTAPDFSGTIYSSATTNVLDSTLTVTGLNLNTTYYFRVGSLNWGNVENDVVIGDSVTLAQTPLANPPNFLTIATSAITTEWAGLPLSPQSQTAEEFLLETSSTNFGAVLPGGITYSSATSNVTDSTLTISGLLPNTTYFFKVASFNWDNTPTFLILGDTSSLANTVVNPSTSSISISSVSVSWSLASGLAEGYVLEASTTSDFSGTIISSFTSNPNATQLAVSGLLSSVNYYFRVGAFNWNDVPNFASAGSAGTSSSNPLPILNLAASTNTATNAQLNWITPTPVDPNPADQPLTGHYAVEHSTWTGVVWSTSNAQIIFSTSGVSSGSPQSYIASGLAPNTTYYFEIWTEDAELNWSSPSNTASLDMLSPLPSNSSYLKIASQTISVSWSALPPSPSSATSEGYELDASTASNFTGTVFSSVTADVNISSLVISGLNSNTTYFFRLGSLNWNQIPNYVLIPATSSLAGEVSTLNPSFLDVFETSSTVNWAALPQNPSSSTSEGYELDASTASDFSGTILSSVTAGVLDSTLTVSGLNPDTTYYFRVGSLNWDQAADFVFVGSTVTSAASPALLSPAFIMVGITSTTVQWGGNANPSDVDYLLNLSTASNFTGALFSSATLNLSATLTGLNPNTTYYAEVKATGINNISSAFTALGSTMTQASPPQTASPSFNPVYITSLTVTFQNGSPANPAGTFYEVQISTDPTFSVWTDSFTQNLNAGFTNLLPDTSYYVQAAGENNLGVLSTYQSLGSTATLSVLPGTLAQSYSNLSGSGFTLSWASGTLATGFNPGNGTYEAQAALNSGFTSGVIDQIVSTTSINFIGLTPSTVYYTRVRGINWQNIPSSYINYGSTQTLQSAIPSFLSGTFNVSDSHGVFESNTLYTDTTTPALQVQILSKFSPGLAVTDTPNTWALWHLDENTGSVGYDSGPNGDNLDLTGSITWQPGIIGSSVFFDGSTTYGYSVNSVNNPTTFTIAAWFKTPASYSSGGKIIGFGNAKTGASSNYDRNIYMINSGQIVFGVNNAGIYTITSPSSYNDGFWHYAMATISSYGMYFYVDGQEVGTNANTGSQNYAGYWRLGYDSLAGWPNPPSSDYFQGNIDEVFIDTNDALSSSQALAYYQTVNNSHELGEPSVDVSKTAGNAGTWTRLPSAASAITGANGTTQTQLWSSTISISGLNLVQSTAPAAPTNQVFFLASDIISEIASSQYTILIDTTPPSVPTFTSLTNPTTYGLTLNSLSTTDNLSGLNATPFDVEASTDPNFGIINQNSGWIAGPNFTFTALLPNTTYFIRAQARSAAGSEGVASAWSSSQDLATLSLQPSATSFTQVNSSLISLSWTALKTSPSSSSSEGYELDASTAPDFSGIVTSSITTNVLDSTLTIAGLSLGTTIYLRVGSLNWAGTINYTPDIPLFVSLSTSVATIQITINNIMSIVAASSVTITNTGTIPETVMIYGSTETAGSPWSLGVSSAIEVAVLQGLWNSTQPSASSFTTAITTTTTISQAVGNYAGNQDGFEIPAGQSKTMWFEFWRPTSSSVLGTQVIYVYFLPVYP